jgi:putative hemolysin
MVIIPGIPRFDKHIMRGGMSMKKSHVSAGRLLTAALIIAVCVGPVFAGVEQIITESATVLVEPTPTPEKWQTEPAMEESSHELLDLKQEPTISAEGPEVEALGETASPQAPAGWTNIMTEGFESPFPDSKWTLYYNGDSAQEGYGYTWDDDPYRYHSSDKSGWCADGQYESNPDIGAPGPYPNYMGGWMIYGPFDLSDAADAELLFYHWTKTEGNYYDYLFVGASTNGSDFYGTRFSGDWASSCSGWCDENFDLTDVYTLGNLCGQSQVWIAFKFHSDYSITDEGSYLDDITLRKETGPVEPDIDVTPTSLSHTCPQTAAAADMDHIAADSPLSSSLLTAKNPAAVYCTHLGYDFQTVESSDDSQHGICLLPDETTCDAWDFLKGKCGQSYSYCAQFGYETKTLTGGRNAFSQEYAVCVSSEGEEIGSVTELSHLAEELTGCGGGTYDQAPPHPEESAPETDADSGLPVETGVAAPASFDWRALGGSDWTTPIKDQGSCGSCWAFSAVGVAEAAHNIASNNASLDLDLSEQYLVSDCYSYLGCQNCCGGWQDEALKYIRDHGITDESCFPYVDGSGCTCGASCDSNCTYRTGSSCSDRTCNDRCSDWASRLVNINSTGYVGTNLATIKQAVVDHGPLSVSMGIGSGYGGYWDGDIYRCTDDSDANHAVAIVGYNDAGGYWIIRNSWGTSWGDDGGCFKLGYGECRVEQDVYYADADPTSGLTIRNVGTADLVVQSISKVNNSCWLSITPQESVPFTLAPGESTGVDVSYDCSCVGAGIHHDTVRIGSTDPDENPFDVPVTIDKPVTCYGLSTSVDPAGSGSVSPSPGPNCPNDPDKYLEGTQVQLTANAVSPYTFSQWSGDASGSANPTTITMNGNKSVTAHFCSPDTIIVEKQTDPDGAPDSRPTLTAHPMYSPSAVMPLGPSPTASRSWYLTCRQAPTRRRRRCPRAGI